MYMDTDGSWEEGREYANNIPVPPTFIPSDPKIHRPIHGRQQKYMRKIPGENESKDEEENMEVDSRE